MRPQATCGGLKATSVRGLKVLVYEAFEFVEDEAHDSEAATEEQVASGLIR